MRKEDDNATSPRSVLVVSQRQVARTPANAVLYEFEDLIVEWEAADLLEVESYHGDSTFDIRRKAFQGLRFAGSPAAASMRLTAVGASQLDLDKTYDVVVLITSTAFDLYTLSQLTQLRKRAGSVVAYVAETWPRSVSRRKLRLEPWDMIDKIFVGVPTAADELSTMLQRPVTPMPAGVDTELFGPNDSFHDDGVRPITVANPGRRAAGQHRLIAQVCKVENRWYSYDTIAGDMSVSAQQHRMSYAEKLRRTNAVVCNPARFDDPERTKGDQIVPYRVFEAMAAGCRMFGQRLPDDAFRRAGLPPMEIPELSLDPTYGEVRSAVLQPWSEAEGSYHRNIASRHLDWAHRWQSILSSLELSPTPQLLMRQQRLKSASEVRLP